MVGITHLGAPLALLERVAIRREARPGLLAMLRVLGCSEAVLLSTGSRVEIYVGNASPGPNELVNVLVDLLAGHSGTALDDIRGVVEVRTGQAVVEHLFDVTAGLSSRVLGEVEILAQTRTAFREATAAGMTGPVLGRLFPAAMRSGRQVRAETTLGEYGRSLARQAVDVGMTSLARSPDPMVLVVGSGQMAQAAVDHLAGFGIQPAVAAQDEAYAARLAGTGAICPLPALTRGITAADLLICATSAAQHVVTVDQVGQAMAGRTRPLTVVDMSVPRNVDAAVAQVDQFVRTSGWGDIDPEARSRTAHASAGKLAHRTTIAARQAAAAGNIDAMRALCDMAEVPVAEVPLAEVGLTDVSLTDVSLTGVDPAWSGSHAQRIAV